ncbi:MAG: hypothetical protein ABW195_18655, partial [Ilumatobacteraceae bacterium]
MDENDSAPDASARPATGSIEGSLGDTASGAGPSESADQAETGDPAARKRRRGSRGGQGRKRPAGSASSDASADDDTQDGDTHDGDGKGGD